MIHGLADSRASAAGSPMLFATQQYGDGSASAYGASNASYCAFGNSWGQSAPHSACETDGGRELLFSYSWPKHEGDGYGSGRRTSVLRGRAILACVDPSAFCAVVINTLARMEP
jgi:hypothetical protein